MQKLAPHERDGMIKLISLLVLLFLISLASDLAPVMPYLQTSVETLPLLLFLCSGSLVLAVILWGLFRGCFPALVVFVIQTVTQLGNVLGYVQFHGTLDSAFALELIKLLLRLTIVLLIFRYEEVIDFWHARQRARTRKWLILEIAIFVLSLLPYGMMMLYSGWNPFGI